MFKTYKAKFKNGEDANLLWDGRDEYCFDIIDYEWNFLFEIMQKTVKSTNTVIQAGGNCGLYPLRLSEHFERVFTFEPDPVNFFCLSTNCKNNKIIKFNTALSNESKFVKIGNPQINNNGMTKILEENESGIVVYSMTIDSLEILDVDLIMLDIEGHEYNALLGCRNTLIKNNPVVLIEITENESKIEEFMKSLGYQNIARMESNTKTVVYIK